MSLSPDEKIARKKLEVLELADALGNVSEACRRRGISRTTFYEYKERFETHGEEVRSKLLDLVLQKPRSLGYPFALWTLERLQEAFFEREEVHLATSTIWEWVEAEGLKWRRQESWFHEAEIHDDRFAEKRGL